jgi:hypothetical protein
MDPEGWRKNRAILPFALEKDPAERDRFLG